MSPLQEKRCGTRHTCQGEVTVQSVGGRTRSTKAQLVNFSEQGICFSIRYPIKPGTDLIYRTAAECHRHLPVHTDCQLRNLGLVSVKWCKEDIRQVRPTYNIGANSVLPPY